MVKPLFEDELSSRRFLHVAPSAILFSAAHPVTSSFRRGVARFGLGDVSNHVRQPRRGAGSAAGGRISARCGDRLAGTLAPTEDRKRAGGRRASGQRGRGADRGSRNREGHHAWTIMSFARLEGINKTHVFIPPYHFLPTNPVPLRSQPRQGFANPLTRVSPPLLRLLRKLPHHHRAFQA